MTRLETNLTHAAVARPNSGSIRTTIPVNITKQPKIGVGDTLAWEIDKVGGKWVAKFTKVGRNNR